MGPQRPVYPHLLQALRVTTSTTAGPTAGQLLYNSFVQQLVPGTLLPRDREPCLALDLNSAGLSPGYYTNCRLAGSFGGLPVYETGVVCGTAAFVSCVSVDWVNHIITVEKKTVNLASGLILATTCETNPNTCCMTRSPCCPNNDLPVNFCITFTDGLAALGSVTLTYDATVGIWIGAGPSLAATCCSTSLPLGDPTQIFFECIGALFYITVQCSDGLGAFLFNGPLTSRPTTFDCTTGIGSGIENVGAGTGPCSGATFTYTIVPNACGSSGSGSGSGSGGGTVSTPCCPAGISETLHATILGTGLCACLSGTYPITWNGVEWRYFSSSPCAGSDTYTITLECAGIDWLVNLTCKRGANTLTYNWIIFGTCALPMTLAATSGTSSGGGTPCCSVLETVSGSIGT